MDCLNFKCLKGRKVSSPTDRSRPPRPPAHAPVPLPVPVPLPLPVPVVKPHKHRLSIMSTEHEKHNDGSSHLYSSTEKNIKFLCSFGGKILPKPSNGQLVYAGGDTRVIAISRSSTFSELKEKIEETFKTPRLVIKYRIMPEDLDALVSVMSDDDMAHMWDEHDKLMCQNVTPNSKPKLLRLFVFQKSPKSPERIPFHNYLDAINYKPSILEPSSSCQVANGPFHKVMSTPNLTSWNHCGGVHPNRGHVFLGMDGPVARRGSYHNIGMSTCGCLLGQGHKSKFLPSRNWC